MGQIEIEDEAFQRGFEDGRASAPGASELKRLLVALKAFRSLVDEGGVPRYTVTPGASLNMVIEEIVDPAIRQAESRL